MQIVTKAITDLKPYENNPRYNDESVDYVANSIKEFGFKVPIVVDADNVIVAGHTRYKACEKLGITEVPCIVADDLTPDQIKAFRLADNKVGEGSLWDEELLNNELADIDLDMTEFGFDEMLDEVEEDAEETDISDSVKEDFTVIIECEDEEEQELVYEECSGRGWKCRVSTL